MTHYLVRKRLPIIKELIVLSEVEWLICMGYGYYRIFNGYTFNCTCENQFMLK